MRNKLTVIDHPRRTSVEHYNDVANCPLSASLNAGYAVAAGQNAGWVSTYLDFLSEPQSAAEMAQRTIEQNPQVVAVHWVYSWSDEQHVFDYFSELRSQGYTGLICAFGMFPTFSGKELIAKAPELDCILLGEFEETLAEILSAENIKYEIGSVHNESNNSVPISARSCLSISDLPATPGLMLKSGPTPKREVCANLDLLTPPADIGKTSQLSYINVSASRGCYGQCSFCFINPYYGYQQWRGRSVDSVILEIKQRSENRNTEFIYFVDPNFFGPGSDGQKRALEMATKLKPLKVKFGLEARVNDIRKDTIEALADAGLESVFLGIESGCDSVLKRMNKHILVEQSEQAITILRDAGVRVSVGFIMFEPDSTLEEIEQNYEFLKRNGLLEHHDLTSNMLYHNQIVLSGTPGFNNLKQADRLIYNDSTPYEAQFTYTNPEVGKINQAMGIITREYYSMMDSIWRQQGFSDIEQFESCHECARIEIPHAEINQTLLTAFTTFLDKIKEDQEADLTPNIDLAVSFLQKIT